LGRTASLRIPPVGGAVIAVLPFLRLHVQRPTVDVQQVGHDLDVDYVLEDNVRRDTINCHLPLRRHAIV
jgi:hypothetical protein